MSFSEGPLSAFGFLTNNNCQNHSLLPLFTTTGPIQSNNRQWLLVKEKGDPSYVNFRKDKILILVPMKLHGENIYNQVNSFLYMT